MHRHIVFLLIAIICQTSYGLVVETAHDGSDEERSLEGDADFDMKNLQERLREVEDRMLLISDELRALREASSYPDVDDMKRRITRQAELPDQLPGRVGCRPQECTPGTLGCPIHVTPYTTASSSCILCPAGSSGPPGPAGPPGRDGRDAITLITSPAEPNTPCSSHGAPYPNTTSGAVYVRWGHHECPSPSEVVYIGTAASSNHVQAGGGVNQLCLSNRPEYNSPISGVGSSRAYIYAVEYQTYEKETTHFHDVPCAVCKAPSRVSKLVIPGTNQCPSSEWTLEYGGYLMAERSWSSHHRSDFICVDREMQVVPRSSGRPSDNKEAFINFVEARCSPSGSGGGIPCGPYIDGYELTCAVCTQ